MKVFGKDVFTKKKRAELYDFAQHGLIGSYSGPIAVGGYAIAVAPMEGGINVGANSLTNNKEPKPPKEKPTITPKELYRLQALNMPDFGLNCDPAYIEKEASLLERKARLIHIEQSTFQGGGKIVYGKQELESLAERLRNRLLYSAHSIYFEQFPYTSSDTINKVLEKH